MAATTVKGKHTQTPLNGAEKLFGPWRMDPWGRLRPELTAEGVGLSLELAATAYDLDLHPWLAAGWTDASIQVDNRLHTGITASGSDRPGQTLKNTWALYRAKRDLRQLNPISRVRSALRQKEQSDTGKAVVMMHPSGDGRYVVAIGFMGTGKRFYDWFSNFRMTSDGGFHKGFLQLARQFEENETEIIFPQTARQLGLEKLTLRDILTDCRRMDSPFRIWMAGHSQGAAVMQAWTWLKIPEDGVQPMHLAGVGFASPTVASGLAVSDPAAYPLYHLCNSDDLVPRVGARVHLGVGLSYPAGEDVRRAACGWEKTPQASVNRALMRRLTRHIVDAPSCLESTLAYMELLLEHNDKWEEGLAPLTDRFAFFKRALDAADRREADLIRFIKRHASRVYFSMTGRTMDPARIAGIKKEMEAVEAQIGLKAMSKTLQELMYWPHTLAGKDGRDGSYAWIVHHGLKDIQPFIWQGGRDPVRLWLRSGADNGLGSLLPSAVAVRRRTPAPRRPLPRRHHGYSARRNA